MDRQRLRQEVYRRHARYDRARRRSIATCPLTDTPLVDNWDLHEVFVKRSAVAPKHQGLIMVIENCVPVQHKAHIATGNTKGALKKCTLAMFKNIGAEPIGRWYRDLWAEHGLNVDRGLLASPKDIRVRHLIPLIGLGAWLNDVDISGRDWVREGKKGTYDLRAQAALRYQGKNRKWKEKGVDIQQLYTWLDDGYWASYILGTMGLGLDEFRNQ